MEAAGVRQALDLLHGHLQDKAYGALGAAIRNLHSQEEQHLASVRTWLREEQQDNELLHQRLKELEEAAELEEAWQQRRQRQEQGPEAAEAQMEQALLARRRGFCHWLQALSLLALFLLPAPWHPQRLYRSLPRVLGAALGAALGALVPAARAGPLPS